MNQKQIVHVVAKARLFIVLIGLLFMSAGQLQAQYYSFTTLAGGSYGSLDGTGTSAQFNYPTGNTAVDIVGNVYVADSGNNTIRKITPEGVVTTLAGQAGNYGYVDGTGSAARFRNPQGLAVDSAGNVYVADNNNNAIRKITPEGVVTTLAGGSNGHADGTGSAAQFGYPWAVAVDTAGNVYVADSNNYSVRKVTPAGVVTTLAGDGTYGYADGTGTAARFTFLTSVAVDASGNVYVADGGNQVIRKITPGGVVTTIAGMPGSSGYVDDTGDAARFSYPNSVAVDGAGNIFVNDSNNNVIRQVTPSGVVTTIGTGLSYPQAIAVDSAGNLYVTETYNQRILKGTPPGISLSPATLQSGYVGANYSQTIAASGGVAPYNFTLTDGSLPDGFSLDAFSGAVTGLGTGPTTNTFTVTVTDSGTYTKDATYTLVIQTPLPITLSPSTLPDATYALSYSQTIVGSGGVPPLTYALTDGSLPDGLSFDTTSRAITGTPTTLVTNTFTITATDAIGVANSATYTIGIQLEPITVNPTAILNGTSGVDYNQTIIAHGGLPPFSYAVTTGSLPDGLTLSSGGSLTGVPTTVATNIFNVTATDSIGNTADANYTVAIGLPPLPYNLSSLAGGLYGSDDGVGASAKFNYPTGSTAVDIFGNVYVGDSGNNTIRKITPAGVVTTLAGQAGSFGFVDGTGSAARFSNPQGLAVDTSGNVYVADSYNYAVRKITPAGVVTTLAGGGYGSSDGTGSAAHFSYFTSVAVDGAGNVYVADSNNQTIRKITPAGVVTTLAGQSGSVGYVDDTGSNARFYSPQGITVDIAGTIYVADAGNRIIRKVTPAGVVTTLAGQAGESGNVDGTGSDARFAYPNGVAVDTAGNVFVCDGNNYAIRKITPAGQVTTAVNGFSYPSGVSVDASGNLYVTDTGINCILKCVPGGGPLTLTLSPSTLPTAIYNVSYNQTFVPAGGGIPPFNYSVTAGSLPAGLSLYYSGSITGAPTALTTNAFTITVTDSHGNSAEVSYTLAVELAPITLAPAGLPGGVVGTNYSQSISASGGLPPLTYSVTTGSLPDGLSFNSSGSLTGIPSAPSTNTFTVTATDSQGNTGSHAYTLAFWLPVQHYSFVPLAGGSYGSADGSGSSAQFNYPTGNTTVDISGNIYLADTGNNTIRKITPDGVVTTLAGQAGAYGYADGTGSSARFASPQGVAVDSSGNVYVADTGNQVIRKITPAGVVTTLAGGSHGSSDGTGSAAQFSYPTCVAVDGADNIYVGDSSNNTVRKITPGGAVTTLAGQAGSYGYADGTGSQARFSYFSGIAADSSGNVYVADTSNQVIRKITPEGVVTTLAGLAGSSGFADGPGNSARFSYPNSIEADSAGNLYVNDNNNQAIRKVTPDGFVTTLADNSDGLYYAHSVSVDSAGYLYVLDYSLRILKGFPPGTAPITLSPATLPDGTLGGNYSQAIVAGGGLWPITFAITSGSLPPGLFFNGNIGLITGLPTDLVTNTFTVTATDANNHTKDITYTLAIQFPPEAYTFVPLAGGSYGNADGTGASAQFNYPTGNTTVDIFGNVYYADTGNHAIRKITPDGVVTTWAGLSGYYGYGYVDGTGSDARFSSPQGVASDSSGNIYVADTGNCVIRKISPAGLVSTLAGQAGSASFADGTGSNARFSYPSAVAVDTAGNVYVADSNNYRLRKITPAGVVTTLAGSGSYGYADGTGTAAQFSYFTGVTVDGAGNIYVADGNNQVIRKVTPAGVVTTLAGQPGTYGFADGTGSNARFFYPNSIAADGTGNLYVNDSNNHAIRKVTPAGVVTTVADNSSGLYYPNSVSVDSGGNLYVADYSLRILKGSLPHLTLLMSPATLPDGTVGVAYNQTVVARGGLPPFTYSVTNGSLPAGLSLNHSSGALTGAPGAAVTNTFTITGTDSRGNVGSITYTVGVIVTGPAADVYKPSVTIASPVNKSSYNSASITVTGTAKDLGTVKSGVASVLCSLNGGADQTATTANHFTNWTANLILAPGTNLLAVRSVDFRGNVSIIVTNTYILNDPARAGIYSGLFYEEGSVSHDTSGYLTFTLTSTRSFNGKLVMGSDSYVLKGTFTASPYQSQVTVARPNKTSLTVAMQVMPTNGTYQATGTVTDGNWTANLIAEKAYYASGGIAPQTGNYTMTLFTDSNGDTSPSNGSYGTATVKTNGAVTLAGALSDTTVLSQMTYISKDGLWPVYVPLYTAPVVYTNNSIVYTNKAAKGSLLGWLTFTNDASYKLTGNASWIKSTDFGIATVPFGNYYTNGFTNALTVYGGSRHQ